MTLHRAWAIVTRDEDWHKGQYWAFSVFKSRREALRCRGAGERVVPIEYRFPKARRRK